MADSLGDPFTLNGHILNKKIANKINSIMDIKEIQNLIKFVAKSGATEVKLEINDFKITIKTTSEASRIEGISYPQISAAPAVSIAAPVQAAPVQAVTPVATNDDAKYITVKSPIIGTFYRKASPDKPSLVEVGDVINKGDVLCIIEAMKLFNEIESEVSGKIVKVLVENNSPVEYDQPLFLVDPS